jgi:hypothetical protein
VTRQDVRLIGLIYAALFMLVFLVDIDQQLKLLREQRFVESNRE